MAGAKVDQKAHPQEWQVETDGRSWVCSAMAASLAPLA